MKNTILIIAFFSISFGAYAQTDSLPKNINPSDNNLNKYNSREGVNRTHDLNSSPDQDKKNTIDNVPNKTEINKDAPTIDKSNPDGITKQNGKMMMVIGGKKTMMEQEMTLSNGTKVFKDGTIINKGNKSFMLKEGEYIDMTGNIIPMNNPK